MSTRAHPPPPVLNTQHEAACAHTHPVHACTHLHSRLCVAASPCARGSRHAQRTAARRSPDTPPLPLPSPPLPLLPRSPAAGEGAATSATSACSKAGAWMRSEVGRACSSAATRRSAARHARGPARRQPEQNGCGVLHLPQRGKQGRRVCRRVGGEWWGAWGGVKDSPSTGSAGARRGLRMPAVREASAEASRRTPVTSINSCSLRQCCHCGGVLHPLWCGLDLNFWILESAPPQSPPQSPGLAQPCWTGGTSPPSLNTPRPPLAHLAKSWHSAVHTAAIISCAPLPASCCALLLLACRFSTSTSSLPHAPWCCSSRAASHVCAVAPRSSAAAGDCDCG